ARTVGYPDSVTYAYSVLPTADNGWVIAGGQSTWAIILKMSSAGGIDWFKGYGPTYGAFSSYFGVHIAQTSDGGYALASTTNTRYFMMLKLNSSGGLVWAKNFGKAGWDSRAYRVVEATDSGYVFAGYSSGWDPYADFLIVKLNPSGTLGWAKTYGWQTDQSREFFHDFVRTADGNYMIAGQTFSDALGTGSPILIKINPDGNLIWAKSLGAAGSIQDTMFMCPTTDGGATVVSNTVLAGSYQMLIFKVNSSGNVEWARTFGGVGGDELRAVIQTVDGGYAATGEHTTSNPDAGFVLKIDPQGNYQGCVSEYTVTTRDTTPSITSVTGMNTIFPSTGSSLNPPDFYTLTETNLCEPVYEYEHEDNLSFNVSPLVYLISDGVCFKTKESLEINIYRPNGMLAFSGNLKEGKNRIPLETGVYFWQAGEHKGKVVVK
ncbi:MAG: hypothetical protein ABIM19_07255, partial [candidate division WOR-3 bacterium]